MPMYTDKHKYLQGEVDKGTPSHVWLEWRSEDEGVTVDILGLESLFKPGVCEANGAPCEELGNGNEILEPSENFVGAR